MLKPYSELVKVDVLPFCEKRDAKNDKNQKIEVPYLNWAKCVDLLHEHGAEVVYFEPCVNANGSSLFMTEQTFGSKEYTHRCYEVRVKIVIDDLVFEVQHPLMNGANPVKDNSLDQRRIWTAQTRAFVKGVAIRTGLGFNLWIKHGDESEDKTQPDDLNNHNIFAIRERMQIAYTNLMKKGMTTREVAQAMGTSEQTVQYYLNGIFDEIYRFEKGLNDI